MQRRKTRTRRRELGAALAAALCLGGCGSGAEHRAAPLPTLSHRLSSDLAARTDGVAQALDAGDSCRALTLARDLQQQTIAAINERRVPGPFQEHLASTVGDLVSRISCVVPPQKEHGDGDGRQKHKKKHGEGD